MSYQIRTHHRPAEPGDPVWISNQWTMRSLPPGLKDRTPMTYVRSLGTTAILSRQDGVEFELDHIQYIGLQGISLDGKTWLPETHPVARQAMLDHLEQLKLDGPARLHASDIEEQIEHMEWILARVQPD